MTPYIVELVKQDVRKRREYDMIKNYKSVSSYYIYNVTNTNIIIRFEDYHFDVGTHESKGKDLWMSDGVYNSLELAIEKLEELLHGKP